ncbi:EAL domain-containing protein [Pseudomonas sp. ESBL9]|uniref:EAL domain-containing protein n=1 Tax=Pseudomonas sp. ESBL9 TaxID=3077327 RepID=UPI002FC61251
MASGRLTLRTFTNSLRNALYRPWSLAILATLLSASLLLALSVPIAMHQVQMREREQMSVHGERLLERLEQLFNQLRKGLDDLNNQPLRDCGPSMIDQLQQVSFQYRFIYEAIFYDGSQICSNWPARLSLTPSPGREPDIKGPVYRYWLTSPNEPDDNLAGLMLGRGDFEVTTSRGHLSDAVDLPPGGSLLVVVDEGKRALPVLGQAQDWPPSAGWPPDDGEVVVTDYRMLYRLPTDSSDYQLVLSLPRAEAKAYLAELWWMLPGSLLIALCMGALVLHLARQRQSLGGELQGALRRGEFKVRYQPIVDLNTRQFVGAEALIRWRHADGTMTSPELFIPLAESTGQIRKLTDFVLERTLEQLGPVLRANPQLYVSINLSACDVMEPRIGKVVARLLAIHEVAASQIAFEVTERGMIDVEVARLKLQALRDKGHSILIDDFGTGYSSLAYLQTLPVDCLKIDKAFIDALGYDAASSGVAPHIIRMAHALNLKVIAEGIEHDYQVELLRSEGVVYGQGWLFEKPLNAHQFRERITGGRRLGPRRADDDV